MRQVTPPVHHSAGRDKVFQEQVLNHVSTGRSWRNRKYPAEVLLVVSNAFRSRRENMHAGYSGCSRQHLDFIDGLRTRTTNGPLGVRFKKTDLLLKLIRADPIVVSF